MLRRFAGHFRMGRLYTDKRSRFWEKSRISFGGGAAGHEGMGGKEGGRGVKGKGGGEGGKG